MFDVSVFIRRTAWKLFLIRLGVTLGFCALIARLIGSDRWLDSFFILAGVLISANLVNWLIRLVATLILIQSDNSLSYEAMFLDDLRSSKISLPTDSYRSWSSLDLLAENQGCSPDDRVAAARLHTMAMGVLQGLPFLQRLQCDKAFDTAVSRYAAETAR